ncbi:MAG: DUF2510 domain-containing protein [Marmoricola sp.]
MTEQMMPPANWYADPAGSGRWRYWDGSAWTGVFLNQPEPGPSVWRQYADKAGPWVFTAMVVATFVSVARGDEFPWFVLALWAIPSNETKTKAFYAAAALVALSAGIAVHSGWVYGLGLAGCGSAACLAGANRERLPRWLVWTVLAFSLSGFGVLWFASSGVWRG